MMIERECHDLDASSATRPFVLVTGAAGGLGRSICKTLSDGGYQIRALVRPEDSRDGLCVRPENISTGYVEDPVVVGNAMKGVAAVINCAALLPNASHLGREAFMRVNVEGAVNVLRQAASRGVGKAIFFSTISVVDHVGHHIEWKQIEQYVDGSGNPYLESKIELEKALRRECENLPVQVQVIRPAFIYGPGNFAVWRDSLILLSKGKMRLIDDGKAPLPLICASDIALFVQLALKTAVPRFAIHILSSREPTTMREVYNLLADSMHVPRPASVSSRLLYPLAAVAERLPRFCRPGRLALLTTARVTQYSRGYDMSGVLEPAPLGFIPPTGFRDGLTLMLTDYLRLNSLAEGAK